jgi:hypothetical protein
MIAGYHNTACYNHVEEMSPIYLPSFSTSAMKWIVH